MNILRKVYDWWRLSKAATELNELDERMLRDIGVSRSEIGRVVRFGRRDGAAAAPWAGSDAGLATVPPAGYKRATNRRPIEALPIRAA
jgi:uncharacterized protein YjiS (DUF1127 family)